MENLSLAQKIVRVAIVVAVLVGVLFLAHWISPSYIWVGSIPIRP